MDDVSLDFMADLLGPERLEGKLVLDVASFDVNGSYRPLIEGLGGQYVGCDVREGPNVDVVVEEFRTWHQWPTPVFDVVICGNALHNMAQPWRVMAQAARVLLPRGCMCVVAAGLGVAYPNNYPADYYRFTVEGLKALLVATGSLRVQRAEDREPHVGAVAWKVRL